MEVLFLALYDFFKSRKALVYGLLIACFSLFIYCASVIKIEEDISKFFPKDERIEKITEVFENSRFMERLVFMVSLSDTTAVDPDKLISYTDSLVAEIQHSLSFYIQDIQYQIDDEINLAMMDTILNNLPLFLTEEDYTSIDSLTQPEAVEKKLQQNYRQLISPAGMIWKRVIARDPLGISLMVLKKMQSFQYDDNFQLYNNCILTKDQRYILFFITPTFSANETGKNGVFMDSLDKIVDHYKQAGSIELAYFGAPAVAVANARQLRTDTIVTGSCTIIFLLLFFIWFFRKKRVPFLIMVPVLFGALFSITCIYLIQGYISVLAIAAGSIVLGIAVNYSLHFFVHLKYEQNVSAVIRDITRPMTIGSFTTVLAFFFLQFTNASVLRDVGLFAGFSLIGAACCTLIFLPHLVSDQSLPYSLRSSSWVEKLSVIRPEYNRYVVIIIFLLTPVFFYFADNVKFNSDMSSLNYMSPTLKKSEELLNRINKFSLRSLYVVAHGDNEEQALQNNEKVNLLVDSLKDRNLISRSSSISGFIISDSLQKKRIKQWEVYWKRKTSEGFTEALTIQGKALGFSDRVFKNFSTLIDRKYTRISDEGVSFFKDNLFGNLIIEKDSAFNIVTLVNLDSKNRETVIDVMEGEEGVLAVDKLMMVSLFVDFIHDDFVFIVTVTSLLVFVVLLISLGRLELTLITFVPMLFTWIWILGLMALLGIEFNIVNVMISTFIFGLGDDYSIFTMDGLQQEYKLGTNNLKSVKISVFLSVVTTVAGLGVLIVAQHPALKSIAAISIIGIVSVFIMSQTLEPFLFAWLITNRTKRGLPPATIWGWAKSIFAYGFFVTGSFILTIVGFVLLKLNPFFKRRMQLIFHQLISWNTGAVIYIMFNLKKTFINRSLVDFNKSQIIICNHSSFLDILLTAMLHRKIILLTNNWVWNSPIFGAVVRMADYYPVTESIEANLDQIKRVTDEGYSLVIFPEGTRSKDGKLKRFHKGAFFLSEKLKLPIVPLMIHGAMDTIQKGDFYVHDGKMTLKFLKPIEFDDLRYGNQYQERTKIISQYYKKEYQNLEADVKTVDYYAYALMKNYVYKGIVLEWYLRIKLKLEKNYAPFMHIIPKDASILDLGCGYGFLCFMMHFVSPNRRIVGVDYDEEKVATALHCYSNTSELDFVHADIKSFVTEETFEVIILSDVLHYLNIEARRRLLEKLILQLPQGGKIIIRDGDKEKQERHGGTKLSEFFSIKLLKFNKAMEAPDYLSGTEIRAIAAEYNLRLQEIDNTKFTSNIIFVLIKD